MPKKKVAKPAKVEPIVEVVTFEEIPQPPDVVEVVERANEPEITIPDLVIQPPTVSAPALPDKMVRVINQGAPFLCDLTMYGYGGRWPTNAVYTIPTSKFVELLTQGLKGRNA